MSMSKQDYELVADVFARNANGMNLLHREKALMYHLAYRLALEFRQRNMNFLIQKFMERCCVQRPED